MLCKENKPRFIPVALIIILAAFVVVLAVDTAMPQNTTIYSSPAPEQKTITVSGSATLSTSPDEVDILLGAETQETKAVASQQNNANIMAAVRSALLAKGVSEGDISTITYSLSPVQDYVDGKYYLTGYRTIHILKIKSSKTDKAGELVDAATGAGANRVDSIQFVLSDQKSQLFRAQVLNLASKDARQKADSIASGLGVSITKVQAASEGYFYIPVYRAMAESTGAAAPTQVSQGEIEVSANVNVNYEFY